MGVPVRPGRGDDGRDDARGYGGRMPTSASPPLPKSPRCRRRSSRSRDRCVNEGEGDRRIAEQRFRVVADLRMGQL